MIEIIHACPANCATGGPEAIHAFVSELNKLEGVHARILYWDIKAPDPCPEEYRTYECEYITEIPPDYDGVMIVPEIWANRILEYKNCTRAIYWLGLDAYAGWTQPAERGKFLQDESIVHIAQSEYAFDLLRKLKVKRLMKCVDLLNADFYADYEEKNRNNMVLFNPAKATPFMERLMQECAGINFRPIMGMTRQQVIEAMHESKLYIDFGEFPGRERIPREAVLCGCCIITSKIGSAAYDEDFDHEYKFDSKAGHIWAIVNRIRYVLDHYDECRKDFDRFRESLRKDADRFREQCKEIAEAFDEIQHHHSGI